MADVETLSAVVIGAVLATVGGFAATRLEGIIGRRERERDAALLFGEILSVLEITTRLADAARRRGESYGPVTLRTVRAIRRETVVYDRNRESLFDLRDAKLRAKIHALMVRMTVALDGVLDATAEIAAGRIAAGPDAPDDAMRVEVAQRIDGLLADRETAFGFAMETIGEIPPIIALLRPLAKHDFDAFASVVADF